VHDECNGSDVFGSDICTCRPYLVHGIEECVPPPLRTKWTRRVPHPVLIGHAASLSQVRAHCARGRRRGDCLLPQGGPLARRGHQVPRTKWTRRVPHPVLIGHAASLSQVTKFLVYNARKRQEGGDRAETYFHRTACVAGVEDMRFLVPACPPPPLVLSGHAASLTPY
jgi:hypothetical protein